MGEHSTTTPTYNVTTEIDGSTDQRIDGPTDQRTDEPTGRPDRRLADRPTAGQTEGRTEVRTDGRAGGRPGGRTDRWADGQTDRRTDRRKRDMAAYRHRDTGKQTHPHTGQHLRAGQHLQKTLMDSCTDDSTHTRAHVHKCALMCTQTQTHTHAHAYIHARTYAHLHTRTHACTNTGAARAVRRDRAFQEDGDRVRRQHSDKDCCWHLGRAARCSIGLADRRGAAACAHAACVLAAVHVLHNTDGTSIACCSVPGWY